MKELIPFGAGLLVGGWLATVRSIRLRAILLPVLCLILGAAASWVNGELQGRWWGIFVSVDAILVWLGALAAFALVTRRARARAVR
jgi:hypothetical protein